MHKIFQQKKYRSEFIWIVLCVFVGSLVLFDTNLSEKHCLLVKIQYKSFVDTCNYSLAYRQVQNSEATRIVIMLLFQISIMTVIS